MDRLYLIIALIAILIIFRNNEDFKKNKYGGGIIWLIGIVIGSYIIQLVIWLFKSFIALF